MTSSKRVSPIRCSVARMLLCLAVSLGACASEELESASLLAHDFDLGEPEAVCYRDPCTPTAEMDVYPSAAGIAGADGAILYIHGGGWNGIGEGIAGRDLRHSGAPAFSVPPAGERGHRAPGFMREPPLAGAGRWTVLSMDYRSPLWAEGAFEAPFPAALEDVKVATRYARKHYANGPKQQLVLMGHSAGGHLAALSAMTVDDEARADVTGTSPLWPINYPQALADVSGRVDGVVVLAGPLDLADWFAAIEPQLDALAGYPYYLSDQVAQFLRCRLPGVTLDVPDELEACYRAVPGQAPELAMWAGLASPVRYVALASEGPEACADGSTPPTCEAYPPLFMAYDRRDTGVPPASGCRMARRYQDAGYAARLWVDVTDQDPGDWSGLPGFGAARVAGTLPPPHAMLGVNADKLQGFFAWLRNRGDDQSAPGSTVASLCE